MLKFQILGPSFFSSAQEFILVFNSGCKENVVSSMFVNLGTLCLSVCLSQVSLMPWAWLREQWTPNLDASK